MAALCQNAGDAFVVLTPYCSAVSHRHRLATDGNLLTEDCVSHFSCDTGPV